MAYFQIEKNPKKRFFDLKTDRATLTPADFEAAAYALMDNAKQYFSFVIRASKGDLNQVLDVWCPFLSNCGLTSELFLKAILCFEGTDYIDRLKGKNRHSLYELYMLLDQNTKDNIICLFPDRSTRNESFELCLQENAQTFFELRYSTEYSQMAGSAYFIPDFMKTLYAVAESNRCQNKTDLRT